MTQPNPYLADLPPAPVTATPRNQGRKTLLLWLFLVLLFVAIYTMLRDDGPAPHSRATATTETAYQREAPLPLPVRVLLPLSPVLVGLLLLRKATRTDQDKQRQLQTLELALAREEFDTVLSLTHKALGPKSTPSEWVEQLRFRALVAVRRGESEQALELLAKLLAYYPRAAGQPEIANDSHAQLLLLQAHALLSLGRNQEAGAVLDLLERSTLFVLTGPEYRLLRLALLARSGDRTALRKALTEHRAELEGALLMPSLLVLQGLALFADEHDPASLLASIPASKRARVAALLPLAGAT